MSPQAPQRPNRPNNGQQNRHHNGGRNGDGNNRGNNNRNNGHGGNNNQPPAPSPWFKTPSSIDKQTSFVEYLRWQRTKTNNSTIDSGTVLELLQKIETGDYSQHLNRLTERTKKLANEFFEVKCPWRIRVGGTKAPESMMLPAFDALGMPYIPSSSLRGVAREMARQDRNCSETELKQIFGDIDSNTTQMGQVIFLDAYPLPGKNNKGGLEPDMTNAIWKWDENRPPKYDNPNPNTFISLKEPTFVIGLRRTKNCPDTTLERVRNWLIKGLAQGIGSRVNSGYGALKPIDKELRKQATPKKTILKVPFQLEGQLIHGQQRFNVWQQRDNGNWQPRSNPVSEVRATAFRCMLRYWFRAFALGVLPTPSVKKLEMELFGGIDVEPGENALNGLFRLETTGKIESKGDDNNPPLMFGTITIRHNSQSYAKSADKRESLEKLLTSLTWLMFHLGGVGQGARRPCYCRGYERDRNGRERKKNPFWRGSCLIPDSKGEYKLWNLPNSLSEFKTLFKSHLANFYSALTTYFGQQIDSSILQTISTKTWAEAIDSNCQIFICKGQKTEKKCFALSVLHQPPLYRNQEVCGGTHPPTPSPVWIRSLDYYHDWQVVTVFGAKTGKRTEFVDKLKHDATECLQVFPL